MCVSLRAWLLGSFVLRCDDLICSYFVSAKTGDNVAAAFYRIVADLSGVVLTPPDVSTVAKVVTAQVIEHPQDTLQCNNSSDKIKPKSKCSFM